MQPETSPDPHQHTAPFALPDSLAAKADPALIDRDRAHFAAVADSLSHAVTELETSLAETRRMPAGHGTAALERDQEVHRLTARLRALRRYDLDLCLGRIVHADRDEPTYIGRFGLADPGGRRLLVDWRSPAAEPFFAATHAQPHGLVSRRRYRWTAGRIVDYWDEAFTEEGLAHTAALDDQSAFIATLGGSRTPRMRDVLATIQADQDAIVRAGSRGALVVDGGPGTGKTVVALHRTAYLLHADPRLGHRRGGVLFVGPHQPYLAYVSDVLPSLGEDGVETCTVRDLVPESAGAVPEADPHVASLKADVRMVAAIEPAVALHEEPPTEPMLVETPWADVRLTVAEWAEAFASPDPGTPHNLARDDVWDAVLTILVDKLGDALDDVSPDALRRVLDRHGALRDAVDRAWPLLEHTDVVGDLWSVPAYLRHCAPWLAPEEVTALRRAEGEAWTYADLPLLDAARLRLGDPEASRRRRRTHAAVARERARMDEVVDDLRTTARESGADEYGDGLVSMLVHHDLRTALVDDGALPTAHADLLAGPFAHVVVDEAQELTDAEWQVLLRRNPSRSFTIVGDRAQARRGFTESWGERLARIGLPHATVAPLTVNYRTPAEVMAEAEPVIRAALPEANVPTSIRESGVPVLHSPAADLDAILAGWLAAHDGTAVVIDASRDNSRDATLERAFGGRVRSLTPETAKGLEFDMVVLVDPERLGDGITGAVDRYVAMTRATQQLVVLTSD
ncbi:RNA polymerase recycling motor ATPase HelR [Nocardioides renjunii]|uniref:RNA polymerase recycling motor ATPase HelR n=1 Tax=Nocardioides renjunii TaxID=3095075 RepID=UPI002B000FF7|nr:RNA polymerase recycling motor ATPase HelR [Nocardioides sp. S-34]WQQ24428.1 RNA polymerase recycling motor ATPase HelR [Nocardioides sp. S-34]